MDGSVFLARRTGIAGTVLSAGVYSLISLHRLTAPTETSVDVSQLCASRQPVGRHLKKTTDTTGRCRRNYRLYI